MTLKRSKAFWGIDFIVNSVTIVTEGDNMDKIIQLGMETRKHDTRISQIETQLYRLEISESEAFEMIETEIIRYNIAFSNILKENQFMLDRQLEALNIN